MEVPTGTNDIPGQGLEQNQNKNGKKKARRGAMIVEKVNKSVRHSNRDIRIDKKKDRSYSRQERPERKKFVMSVLVEDAKIEPPMKMGEKESTGKLNGTQYVQIG